MAGGVTIIAGNAGAGKMSIVVGEIIKLLRKKERWV